MPVYIGGAIMPLAACFRVGREDVDMHICGSPRWASVPEHATVTGTTFRTRHSNHTWSDDHRRSTVTRGCPALRPVIRRHSAGVVRGAAATFRVGRSRKNCADRPTACASAGGKEGRPQAGSTEHRAERRQRLWQFLLQRGVDLRNDRHRDDHGPQAEPSIDYAES